MLLGMVAWIMSLFYFVNWPDEDVQQATWDTLSAMITIFCGVLLFSAIKCCMVDFAGEEEGDHHAPPDYPTLVLSFTRFFALLGTLQLIFFVCRKNTTANTYIGSVGSHVVGFAAIDCLGGTLQQPVIATSMFHCVLAVLACALFLNLIFQPLALARKNGAPSCGAYLEECDVFDTESLSLCLGLLISLLLRKCVTGDLPPVHGSPKYKTEEQVLTLLVVSVISGIFVALLAQIYRVVPGEVSQATQKTIHLIREISAMTMGWCLLYTGYWAFYQQTDSKDSVGGAMTMRVVMALVFSAITLAAIIVLDMVADRARSKFEEESVRSLLVTFSLLMGLSWESCFSQAVENLGYAIEVRNSDAGAFGYGIITSTFVQSTVTVALCAVVLPAWAWYILPHTSHFKHVQHLHHGHHGHEEKKHDEEEHIQTFNS